MLRNIRQAEQEVEINYNTGIKNAVTAGAPDKSTRCLKYLYFGISETSLLSHEDAYNQIIEDSRKVRDMTDFSEENICQVMYGGDREQMEYDYQEAIGMKEALDDYF